MPPQITAANHSRQSQQQITVGKKEMEASQFMFTFIIKMKEVPIWDFGDVNCVKYPINEARAAPSPLPSAPSFTSGHFLPAICFRPSSPSRAPRIAPIAGGRDRRAGWGSGEAYDDSPLFDVLVRYSAESRRLRNCKECQLGSCVAFSTFVLVAIVAGWRHATVLQTCAPQRIRRYAALLQFRQKIK